MWQSRNDMVNNSINKGSRDINISTKRHYMKLVRWGESRNYHPSANYSGKEDSEDSSNGGHFVQTLVVWFGASFGEIDGRSSLREIARQTQEAAASENSQQDVLTTVAYMERVAHLARTERCSSRTSGNVASNAASSRYPLRHTVQQKKTSYWPPADSQCESCEACVIHNTGEAFENFEQTACASSGEIMAAGEDTDHGKKRVDAKTGPCPHCATRAAASTLGKGSLHKFDILFVTDPNARWYSCSAERLDVDDFYENLGDVTRHYKRNLFIGTSMGAFMALYCAELANSVQFIS